MALRAKPDQAADFAAQWLESDLGGAVNSHPHRRIRAAEAPLDAKFNLIGRYPRRSHNRLQSRGVIARGLCLRRAFHFVQDLGEHEILPGLIWFPGHCAALSDSRLFEMVFMDENLREQIQRLNVVHIEQGSITQRLDRARHIIDGSIKATGCQPGSVMPPIGASETFNKPQSLIRSLCLSKNFAFQADKFPNFWIVSPCPLKNSHRGLTFSRFITHQREV